MKFIVATPSYNNLSDLRRCIGSVKAQALPELSVTGNESRVTSPQKISVQHLIQDGGSEGFPEFASQILESEKVTMCEGKKVGVSQNLPTFRNFPPSHLSASDHILKLITECTTPSTRPGKGEKREMAISIPG
jgi:hypothetical protein